MTSYRTPQTRCRAAMTRAEITPPVGIYHRMWGAARHDRATGVHRPLTATLLWLEPVSGDGKQALLIAALDHCILDNSDVELIQRAAAEAVSLQADQVIVTLSHTHAAGLMSRSRADCPGGDLIGPYLDELAQTVANLARTASHQTAPATIVYGRGRCALAAHRDFFDAERNHFVCGFHPDGPADDTLLIGRVEAENGQLIGSVVNYACHPTTLAWDNTLISPDYPGALRDVIERETSAPCLFLQGASGDLGPREGFTGDTAIADRNGRELAYAALSTWQTLPRPGTAFQYQGPVVSGAIIGDWQHRPLGTDELKSHEHWSVQNWTTPLPYRMSLATVEETQAERDHWLREEERWTHHGDALAARDWRAKAEQMTRQLWRLSALPAGKAFPLKVTLARFGDAAWVFVPGEHYQSLQTGLRSRFPDQPLLVTTLSHGWQPGYIPPASVYGYGIYQEHIAVVEAGSAELLLEDIARHIRHVF